MKTHIMNWSHNLSTRTKISLGTGLILALLLAAIVIAVWSIANIEASLRTYVVYNIDVLNDIVRLRDVQNEQRLRMLSACLDKEGIQISNIDIQQQTVRFNKELESLMVQMRDDKVAAARLIELKAAAEAYQQGRAEQLALLKQGKMNEALAMGAQVQATRFEKLSMLESVLYTTACEDSLVASNKAQAQAETAKATMGVIGIIAILLAWVLAVTLGRAIADPLRVIASMAERLAAGDLAFERTNMERKDEFGVLARSFVRLADNLRSQIQNIAEGVSVLSSAAAEISTSTTQFAATSAETAASVSETTTTMEELRQTTAVSSQKAKSVSETSAKAVQIAQVGRKAVDDTVGKMSRIREQMEFISDKMMRLNEQALSIGLIVTTVEDLAGQSNMLAVNAGIEAAKAGEQGRGFAVVAQEVRNLAEQSKQATAQVTAILREVQKATSAAMLATEQGNKAVEVGVTQAAQAGQAIVLLSSNVSESADAAIQIAASSQQQLVGADQVASSMEGVRQASLQNVDGAKQLESAAHNLKELGERLKRLTAHYKF